jgi:hypothetical protein
MTATATHLQAVDVLAARLLKKFQPGLLRLAQRAGWRREDLPGVAWLAAHDALAGFDLARGDLDARGWFFCQQQARGFLPASCGADDLRDVAGGDDPAVVVEAAEEIGRLLALGAGVEREPTSARTGRRWRANARGAAEALLRGGGRQGELF